MKLTFFTLLLLTTIGLVSCRKNANQIDIKQYDQQQILSYIAANGLTAMKSDTTGMDTSGIYYQILTPGTGKQVDYPDSVSFVYARRTFDGKYIADDTVYNHYNGPLGHISLPAHPVGVMIGIRNLLKYKGGKIRLLIPSHLAYGTNGYGTGSNTITSGRIAGNQCFDYIVNLVNNQDVYDNMVIKNYMTANSLSGYTEITSGPYSGLWYKIITVGTGGSINDNSSVTANYSLRLMNNVYADSVYATTAYTFNDLQTLTDGAHLGLKLAKGGNGAISLLVPSRLGYGPQGSSTGGIPSSACLRFEFYNITATNY
jgi:FKBP-type peptidyl-prolyl cis-trans isomerase FkpA